jgi:predicted dehydrogenase
LGNGLLVGYGSIGRYHARIATARYESVAIVDQFSGAREQAVADHKDAVVAEDLHSLTASGWDWSDTTAVIATWGPSHFDVFNGLVDVGVRRILCEKPIADSLAKGHEMLDRARRDGVTLGVHHHRRYSGLTNGLNHLAREYDLGEPVKVVVHGGAAGVVTNGIHYIDWASELFDSDPSSVVSTAAGESLNPRSESLNLYGGTAVWTHDGGQETVISFSNQSSIAASTLVYYRDATVDIGLGLEVVIRTRDSEQTARFPAVTRTGAASEEVFAGAVDGVLPVDQATLRILDEIDSGTLSGSLADSALTAMGACVGALEAGKRGQRIDLPIDPESDTGQQTWPMS